MPNDSIESPDSAAKPLRPAEFERRIRILCARAGQTTKGRIICSLCAKDHADGQSHRRHLRRYHREEIISLPAKRFE